MVVAESRDAEGPAGACIPGAVAVPMSMAVRAKRNRRLPAELDRRFEAVVFDWDGTAVPDRSAEAGALRELVEELSALGFDLGVVTGTHVGNVDGQLQARPAGPGRLFLCVNRGSEVFRAEAMSGLGAGEAIDEEGAEGFVLTVGSVGGLDEEAGEVR